MILLIYILFILTIVMELLVLLYHLIILEEIVHRWDRQSTYDNYIATVYRTLGQQRKNKNDSIKSYLEQHGLYANGILMNVLTFGNVSHLFTLQKRCANGYN